MKKIIAILSLVCFTVLSISSYAGGDAKPACCQKGGTEGKACCKDAKGCSNDKKNSGKDHKSCSGDSKSTTPAKEEKKDTK